MAKLKIHEIAKKYDLTSKEVLDKAVELGIDAKSHLSSIEGEEKLFLMKRIIKKRHLENQRKRAI